VRDVIGGSDPLEDLSGMTSLVNDTFAEWTHDLDTRGSMISIFSHIRDIPYLLNTRVSDPKNSMAELLEAGKGSCGPKHYLLAEMYRKLNVSVVYATIAFSWNDPDLRYPPGLRELAVRLPIAHHLACRVQIGCRWMLVDATWDRPLAKAGFPVNDHWDGYSEMKCAVKPLQFPERVAFCRGLSNEPCRIQDEAELCPPDGEKNHWQVEDRARYYREKVSVRSSDEVTRIAQFFRGFDAWLVDVRNDEYHV
jgi:hypothetical protein